MGQIQASHTARREILYLCNRQYFKHKMSRTRFHTIHALGEIANVKWSGPGWDNYQDKLSVQENIHRLYGPNRQPDLVLAYKPFEMINFSETIAPRAIRYNEMYDVKATLKEILANRVSLVVCHHRNDYLMYQTLLKHYPPHTIHLANLPHCADNRFYRDYQLPKQYDLLLVGAVHIHSILGSHYPLRDRLQKIVEQMSKKYRCQIHQHPGYHLEDADADRNTIEYAKAINSAKICLTCSGLPLSRFGKYVEIPMCGTALAADLPDEDQESFKQFMIVLDPKDSDQQLSEKLEYYLAHENERLALVQKGLSWSQNHTQDKYAQRLLSIIDEFLAEYRQGEQSHVPIS